MSEDRMPVPAAGDGGRHPRRHRALRHLATIAAGLVLAVVVTVAWSVHRTLGLVQGERTRLQALEDSLRVATPSESRLQDLEQRLSRLERSVSHASRAARVPEVMALRRWARRLDVEVQTNTNRIVGVEKRVDSLSVVPEWPDTLHGARPGD